MGCNAESRASGKPRNPNRTDNKKIPSRVRPGIRANNSGWFIMCVECTNQGSRERQINSDTVMNAESPSQAWSVLTSIAEDQDSTHAKENAETEFESMYGSR